MYDGFNPRRVAEDPTLPFYGQDLPPLPDIEADRSAWDIVSWPIRPGDVVLAHPGVLHGGGATREGGRRRTLTVRCYGDDIVYATRPPSRPTVPLTPGAVAAAAPG
jgi:ectoine hydroxylase-related dioxygenase (phytanoyl-CoA dioxygenase family)